MSPKHASKLFIFDIDGTLTASRKKITPDMEEFMSKVTEEVTVALVGGSDFVKINEQLNGQALVKYEYVFSENGLVYHRNGELVATKSIQEHMGNEKLQSFINFALKYMSELTLPCKRGTFIEFRKGMLNVCPVGRSCSQEERDEFGEYDKVHHIREKFVAELRKQFPEMGLVYSIGGQISFDVFPEGWDKRYCLQHLFTEGNSFTEVHFFGDKTFPGGNDHEIFTDPRIIGHTVTSPEDTRKQLTDMLFS
ncbi:PMM1 [Bugula neritina]|uniref:Phosphomannomutase n=1 Tax=Bugula neritina TaxID=10212 RepID=A0A7J7JHA4_BUGNE|nr:PMM1 [Bugula neritina]